MRWNLKCLVSHFQNHIDSLSFFSLSYWTLKSLPYFLLLSCVDRRQQFSLRCAEYFISLLWKRTLMHYIWCYLVNALYCFLYFLYCLSFQMIHLCCCLMSCINVEYVPRPSGYFCCLLFNLLKWSSFAYSIFAIWGFKNPNFKKKINKMINY
jgi:hypothetical protein